MSINIVKTRQSRKSAHDFVAENLLQFSDVKSIITLLYAYTYNIQEKKNRAKTTNRGVVIKSVRARLLRIIFFYFYVYFIFFLFASVTLYTRARARACVHLLRSPISHDTRCKRYCHTHTFIFTVKYYLCTRGSDFYTRPGDAYKSN